MQPKQGAAASFNEAFLEWWLKTQKWVFDWVAVKWAVSFKRENVWHLCCTTDNSINFSNSFARHDMKWAFLFLLNTSWSALEILG